MGLCSIEENHEPYERAEVYHEDTGRQLPARLTECPLAVVNWVDGTVLDTIWQVA